MNIKKIIRDDVLERFIEYVKIDTESTRHSNSTPSTNGQWDLLNLLKTQLESLGVKDISLNDMGYLPH